MSIRSASTKKIKDLANAAKGLKIKKPKYSKPLERGMDKVKEPMPSILKTYADDLEYQGKHKYSKDRDYGIEMKTPKGIETQKSLDKKLIDTIKTKRNLEKLRKKLRNK